MEREEVNSEKLVAKSKKQGERDKSVPCERLILNTNSLSKAVTFPSPNMDILLLMTDYTVSTRHATYLAWDILVPER